MLSKSSRLIIACMSTYESTISALESVADWTGATPGQPRERRRRRARRRSADATFDPRSSASATPGVFTTTVAAPSAAASAPIRPI
jgi:hypothetical protein